ncbi:MAG: hypothetical protein JNK05_06900 [Myxococcales bacterium]|nr:hypothetical protein [Myxococcales bacterium]
MAAEILGELLITLGAEIATKFALAGPVREWKLDRFYNGMNDEQRSAFLDLVALAINADGAVSAIEQRWLERRKEVNEDVAKAVDTAFERTKSGLPEGLSSPDATTYLSTRVAKFTDDDDRERIYLALAVLLRPSGQADTLVKFRDALALSTTKAALIDARIDSWVS